jgi:hypothetical protein
VLDQDKVLQHDPWWKNNPLPSTIFARPHKTGLQLEPGPALYTFDVVL